jgi:peptidoglycan-associated lipoprotein
MPIKVEGILMYVRVLSLFAAILLVAACQTTPTTTAVSGGEGSVPATGGEGARGIGGSSGALGDVVSTPIPHVELQQWLSTNIGDRVNFALDKYSISQAAATRLERQSVWLKDNPAVSITIGIATSAAPANTTSALVTAGLMPSRITW